MTGWILAAILGPFAGYVAGNELADWQARREFRRWWRPTAPISTEMPTVTVLPDPAWRSE